MRKQRQKTNIRVQGSCELSAGNFKEMARMTGLCNICNEVGAKSWDNFFELIDILSKR